MKKLVLVISLFFIVGLAVFVSAKMTGSIPINKGNYDVELTLSKGWNLILVGPLLGSDYNVIKENSDIKKEDIKVIYYYFRNGDRYLQMYPNREETDGYLRNAREKPEEAIYFMQSPVWIYSNKAGVLRYTKTDLPALNNIVLNKGWNFITITPEMEGISLNELKGSCNIKKAYLWDTLNQQWGTILNLLDDKNILAKEGEIGNGLVIEVLEDCQFGGNENLINPPAIPN